MINTISQFKIDTVAHNQIINMRVSMDFSDYNLDNTIETLNNDPALSTDDSQLSDGIEKSTYEWPTFANPKHGIHHRDENHTGNEKGYISNRLSNQAGDFIYSGGIIAGLRAFTDQTILTKKEEYPEIQVSFAPRTVTSLKAVFEEVMQQWAIDFDIIIYVNGTYDSEVNVTGNTSFKWTYILPSPILLVTGVKLVIKKINVGVERARVLETFTSLKQIYDTSDIKELNILERSEPEGTIPVGNAVSSTINLTLKNIDRKFDNENLLSVLAGNVIKNRRISVECKINNNEWLPIGTFYSDIWDVDNLNMNAQVSGVDIVSLMDQFKYTKSQFITPGIDQNFTYTTTAEFDLFIRSNVLAENDSLVFSNSAIVCPEVLPAYLISGLRVFSSLTVLMGEIYCGTADVTIPFTYTPGTSITMSFTATENKPWNTNIKYFASYKSIDEWNEISGNEYIFTPENISETSQTVKLRVFFTSQSLDVDLSVDDISVTLNEKISLYSLAAKIFDDFDDDTGLIEGRYLIDQSFGMYEIPTAFFSKDLTYRACLKKIAEAGAGRFYQRKDQYVVLETLKTPGTPDKIYTDTLVRERHFPMRPQDIYNRVSVIVNKYNKSASPEQACIATIEILDGEVLNTTLFFKIDPTEDLTYSSLPAGVTITGSTEYTWGVDLEITNASGSDQTFTLTISGYTYTVTGGRKVIVEDTQSINKSGINELTIDNYLIQSIGQAQYISSLLLASYKAQKRTIVLNVVPDISMETGDTIQDTNFYIVNSNEIDYNESGLRQVLEGVK